MQTNQFMSEIFLSKNSENETLTNNDRKLKARFICTWSIPKLNGIILFGSIFSEYIFSLSFIYCNGVMRNQLPVKSGDVYLPTRRLRMGWWRLSANDEGPRWRQLEGSCLPGRWEDMLESNRSSFQVKWLHKNVEYGISHFCL